MKTFTPLGNNCLVKRVTKKVTDELVDGIWRPENSQPEHAAEEVTVVAISPELHLNDTTEAAAKVGDRCLIHRGLNSIPIDIKGVPHLLVSYLNLLGVVG